MSAEQQTPDKKFGVHLSNLGRETFEDILRIYDGVAFTQGSSVTFEDRYPILWRRMIEKLSKSRVSEWRYGSRFSTNSKLIMRSDTHSVVSFEFYPNMDRDNPQLDAANESSREFEKRVKEYLAEKGIVEEGF